MELKLETVPIVVCCCFVLQNICEMRRNCEVDDVEVQAQIKRDKRDEEKTPNRLDAFYSYINSEGQKIREVIKEYLNRIYLTLIKHRKTEKNIMIETLMQ